MSIDTDYLIVGAGAAGLAFADTLLRESDAAVTIVDERGRPGGHWNDAYRFVRLHQPSAYYGVNSTPLGRDAIDTSGPNAGLCELATGAEVCAYFEQVMEQVLVPSGRVQYFPMCRFEGDGRFVSLVTGVAHEVRVRKKTVDTAYAAGTVPSRHKPSYSIAPRVRHVPANALANLDAPSKDYVIVGAGKTGMDACLWLIDRGVDPEAICWIMPQDAWLFDRALAQPDGRFFETTVGGLATQMEAAAEAKSIADLFLRLETAGSLLRLDPNVAPTAYRCATVNQSELQKLRQICNVVRRGRVQAIEHDRIVLDRGEIATGGDVLHVDCSAKGVAPRPMRPVFDGRSITVQFVRTCQPTFSAALIAYVEAHYEDEAKKNRLCGVVQSPERDIDWLRMAIASALNAFSWSQEPGLRQWLLASRLNGFSGLLKPKATLTPEQRALQQRLRNAVPGAIANLQRLLA